jgi:hypothetical protein
MRREVQVVIAMPQLAETQRLAALEKLHSDINVFVTRGENALSLYTTDLSCRKISHALYTVTRIVTSLRELWTLTEDPSFDMIEINILSNCLGECAPILDKIDTVVKLDNQSLPGESSDRGPHRISNAFAANEVVEAKRILHACFHTVSEAIEDGKTRKLARDAAR